jgi:cob(I)alamin adenosyltransferase
MNTGFTWDTQNQEVDKKMALETWEQAEQYLKDKAINLVVLDERVVGISIIDHFATYAGKSRHPV